MRCASLSCIIFLTSKKTNQVIMHLKRRFAVVMAAFFIIHAPVVEAARTSADTMHLSEMVKSASGDRARFEHTIPGGPEGLTGIVCSDMATGRKFIAWVPSAAPNTVITGSVYGANGVDYTYKMTLEHVLPKVPYEAPKVGVPKLGGTNVVTEVSQASSDDIWESLLESPCIESPRIKSGRSIYVFFETSCAACRMLHKEIDTDLLQEACAGAGVGFKWLPVQLLDRDSRRSGAELLAMKTLDPSEVCPSCLSERRLQAALKAVDDNSRLALQLVGDEVALPLIVWRGADGEVHVQEGAPSAERMRKIIADARGTEK
jgi:hypothetical protein